MARPAEDSIGERHGRVLVLSLDHRNGKSKAFVIGRCDCGNERLFQLDHLRRGLTTTCGCAVSTARRARNQRLALEAIARRLANYVPEPTTGCWLWLGPYNDKGYGATREGGAHRFFWEQTHGEIPVGLHVLHRCDTPPCVNPDHLFLGTHQDNMRDMAAKGRQLGPVGELSHNHVLTETTARQALQLFADGMGTSAAARALGIGRSALKHLRAGETWRHIPRPSTPGWDGET